MPQYADGIKGNLDIIIIQKDRDDVSEPMHQKVLIHGDPDGLRSLANLLLKLADLNQDDVADLPIGAREHRHLMPGLGLSSSSEEVILGRLDAKGTGAFYDRFIPANQ